MLAARRAKSVAAILRRLGVAAERLKVLSFGERHPIRRGGSNRAMAINRRVEFVLLKATTARGWFASGCGRR